VHTASAGAVGPSANYDDLVVENSDHCGITLLAPNDKYTGLIFGNPADQDEGWVKQYSNQLFFGIDSGDRMRMTASMLAFHQATTLVTDAGALTLTPSTGVIVSSGKYLEIASVLTAGILRLDGGDISSGINNRVQIAFGFNTSDDYPHFIRTRHNATPTDNAIDFYTGDGTQNGVFPGNAVLGLVIESGKVGVGVIPVTTFTVEGAMTLKELAAAEGDTASYGQLWTKDDAPCILMFTDDAGTDFTVDITPV